ncbi:hypothetical protein B0H10DRAFT_1954228 [Mycena sp. CBHHK59/15]|nr:hypothetical protein B0H10DRAFT_1954228 [Mycena sp. CBHHK59/15]
MLARTVQNIRTAGEGEEEAALVVFRGEWIENGPMECTDERRGGGAHVTTPPMVAVTVTPEVLAALTTVRRKPDAGARARNTASAHGVVGQLLVDIHCCLVDDPEPQYGKKHPEMRGGWRWIRSLVDYVNGYLTIELTEKPRAQGAASPGRSRCPSSVGIGAKVAMRTFRGDSHKQQDRSNSIAERKDLEKRCDGAEASRANDTDRGYGERWSCTFVVQKTEQLSR